MSDENRAYGVYAVEDGNPPATGSEFDPRRKVRIEIGFTYPSGDLLAQQLKIAADIAEAELAKRLGRRPEPAVDAQVSEVKPKATRKAKADTPPPAPEPEVKEDAIHEADPFVEAAGSDAAASEVQESPVEEEDPFLVQPEAAAEISDADLMAAIREKNREIDNATAITALIRTFNPDPAKVFQAREISQAQRPDFLAKLALLKKA